MNTAQEILNLRDTISGLKSKKETTEESIKKTKNTLAKLCGLNAKTITLEDVENIIDFKEEEVTKLECSLEQKIEKLQEVLRGQ